MHECEPVRELIPWYVTGTLDSADVGAVDAHLEQCAGCRADVIESMRLRTEAKAGPEMAASLRHVWDTLDAWLDPPSSQIDVGSFLLGLSFGVSAGRRTGSAGQRAGTVHGSLRVLGQDVRILGRKKKGA